jgi:hypothetical protein
MAEAEPTTIATLGCSESSRIANTWGSRFSAGGDWRPSARGCRHDSDRLGAALGERFVKGFAALGARMSINRVGIAK